MYDGDEYKWYVRNLHNKNVIRFFQSTFTERFNYTKVGKVKKFSCSKTFKINIIKICSNLLDNIYRIKIEFDKFLL